MSRQRKERKSDPAMLAARMDKAHAEGKPLELEYDEVTGVIDCALERGDENTTKGVSAVQKLIAKINATPALPPAKPAT